MSDCTTCSCAVRFTSILYIVGMTKSAADLIENVNETQTAIRDKILVQIIFWFIGFVISRTKDPKEKNFMLI